MTLNYTRTLVPDIPYICRETGQNCFVRMVYRFHQYCAEVSYSTPECNYTRLHCVGYAKRYGPKTAHEMKQRFYEGLPGFIKIAEKEWFNGKALEKVSS